MSDRHADLEVLGSRASTPAAPPRRRGGRWTLALLVLGLAAAGGSLVWPLLFPARAVRMARVRVLDAQDVRSATRVGEVVEDVGWLEADPFPVTVRPLVRGVLDHLAVVEGDAVKAGETVIGTLRSLPHENALTHATAIVAWQSALVERARVGHAQAQAIHEQNLAAKAAQAEADGRVLEAQRDVDAARADHAAALAAVEVARTDLAAQQALVASGSDTPVARARAAAQLKAREADAAAAATQVKAVEARVLRAQAVAAVAAEGVKDPRALAAAVANAAQDLAAAEARLTERQVEEAIAKRNVAHLEVRAPTDGIVLRLEAAPGAVVGPEGEFKEGDEGGPGSTTRLNRMTGTLVSLYDPAHLQVRVDVLFGRVRHIREGSKVTFTVDALPGQTFHGTVSRFVHEADINQNALQVKVRVTDPIPAMRPEMLCRVRFAAHTPEPESAAPAPASAGRARLAVPDEAVRDGAVHVWDPRGGGQAKRVPVKAGPSSDGWTEVEGDLGQSSRVILDPVEHGEAVKEATDVR